MTFHHSTDLGLPLEALRRLGQMQPFVLIGAYARDVIVYGRARMDRRTRATSDVDITVMVADREALRAVLEQPSLSRASSGIPLRRRLDVGGGIPVDVLPYGDLVEPNQVLELDGFLWNLTGMREAAEHAETHVLPGGVVVRCPTLASMLVLKLVAGYVRHGRKDAEDLGILLDASGEGDYADLIYEDERAGRWEYDLPLAGPYLQGLHAAQEMRPQTLEALREKAVPRIEVFADVAPRHHPNRILQYEAFFAGLFE